MLKSSNVLRVVLPVAMLLIAPAAADSTFAVDCNDGNPCTIDTVDPATGGCVYTPVTCNDGNSCTRDECDPLLGGCRYVPDDSLPCSDVFNRCTIDRCDGGYCRSTPVVCNDGNPCTEGEFCNPTTGGCMATVFLSGPCDDENGCTSGDVCASGYCAGSPDPGCCDDADACTTDRSDPATGACTHVPIVCRDYSDCTDDRCDPASGCVFLADDTNACDIPGDCFVNDRCEAGRCVGDTTPSCDPDGDGVATFEDQCPESILDPTVVIPPSAGSPTPPATILPCDSGVPNVLISAPSYAGCTISDMVARCEGSSATTKEFVRCVKYELELLRLEQVVTDRQRKAIEKCAKRFQKRRIQYVSGGGALGGDDH